MQLQEYQTFTDLGQDKKAPQGYRNICVHFIFVANHGRRHKARLVTDRHLAETPIDSVYSGVISLQTQHIVVFLAELNDLQLWGTDIRNATLSVALASENSRDIRLLYLRCYMVSEALVHDSAKSL